MFSQSFRQFIYQEAQQAFNSDGKDAKPAQTAKIAQTIAKDGMANPDFTKDLNKLKSDNPQSSTFSKNLTDFSVKTIQSQKKPPNKLGASVADVTNAVSSQITGKKFFMRQEAFQLYGDPKMVHSPLGLIKTDIKQHQGQHDGKTPIKRSLAFQKRTLTPACPAGLHGSDSLTIQSPLKKKNKF